MVMKLSKEQIEAYTQKLRDHEQVKQASYILDDLLDSDVLTLDEKDALLMNFIGGAYEQQELKDLRNSRRFMASNAAMNALLMRDGTNTKPKWLAIRAVEYADALIERLDETHVGLNNPRSVGS